MKALRRRTLLRGIGIGGLAVALPQLEAMIDGRATPSAQAAPGPARLVIFHWPQGIPAGWGASDGGFWYPTQEGSGYSMTEGLAPLEPYRDQINVVSGITYQALHQSIGAHGHAAALFTGHKPLANGSEPIAQGPSIDRLAASRIGGSTKFSGIATGLYEQGEGWWSWSDAGVKHPLELEPQLLFSKLFSDVDLEPDAAAAASARNKSILDFVRTDIESLQKVLGAGDRQRLEQHLDAIRELEKQVTTGVSAECSLPPEPGSVAYSEDQMTEYTQLMLDLVAMALRCDLTRVALISLGPSQNYRVYKELGVGVDYHNVCHSNSEPGDIFDQPGGEQIAQDWYRKIALWHMEQLAYMLAHLSADDGTGSMLDQSAFIATSEFSGGGLHYHHYLPMIVAGKINGMATGQHLVFPCDHPESWQEASWCASKPGTPNRCVNDVWQSALMAVGALGDGEVFGDPGIGTQPLAGLW
jgi:hypothetical protein